MANASVKVDVHHITRVEGHGNIVVDVQNGELKQCDLQIVETPRFIESMLRGRPFGGTGWVDQVARHLRLESTLRDACRPRHAPK